MLVEDHKVKRKRYFQKRSSPPQFENKQANQTVPRKDPKIPLVERLHQFLYPDPLHINVRSEFKPYLQTI